MTTKTLFPRIKYNIFVDKLFDQFEINFSLIRL